jgi:uncharacterized protein YjbI with pentapeptide repeats
MNAIDKYKKGIRSLKGADFAGADLSYKSLSGKDVNLQSAVFTFSDCTGTSFAGANLSLCNFAGAHLEGTNFAFCDLKGANFEGATLIGCNFHNAINIPNSLNTSQND